ncbi:hypothetical protein DFH06DRAFT_1347140 [Mycena polygramma]|nr:hypothetical protein DFH06DRAFT_1347140 [Mycena polygramma]
MHRVACQTIADISVQMLPPVGNLQIDPQSLRDQLAELNKKIQSLSERLQWLRRDQDGLQEQLDKVVYPVLTVPIEITAEIFICCLPETTVSASSSAAVPLVLARVCRAWRAIAVSTPRLWASLELTIPPRHPPQLFNFFGLWLSRSNTCPLTLVVAYVIDSDQGSQALTDLLGRHAHHLVEAQLWLPRADLVRLFKGSFPRLKRIQITETGSEPTAKPHSFSGLKASTMLRELALNNDTLHPLPYGIPWAQLARFQGFQLSATKACEILKTAPSLKECMLEFGSTDRISASEPKIGALSQLRSWKFLTGTTVACDHGIFDLVTVPALVSLQVKLDDNSVPRFLSLVARSCCCITDVRIHCVMGEAKFVQCLAALPHLVTLYLTHSQVVLSLDFLATSLHRCRGHLPRLEILKIFSLAPGAQAINYPLLVEMLASRRDTELPRLRFFRLKLPSRKPRKPDANIRHLFRVLERKGLQMNVEGINPEVV